MRYELYRGSYFYLVLPCPDTTSTARGQRVILNIKSRQTLKFNKFVISLERFGLGGPLTIHNEGVIEANRLTLNLMQFNNTKTY